jgi:hypothetical protein
VTIILEKKIEFEIYNFIKSEDLTLQFSSEYSKDERAIFHKLAEKLSFKHLLENHQIAEIEI